MKYSYLFKKVGGVLYAISWRCYGQATPNNVVTLAYRDPNTRQLIFSTKLEIFSEQELIQLQSKAELMLEQAAVNNMPANIYQFPVVGNLPVLPERARAAIKGIVKHGPWHPLDWIFHECKEGSALYVSEDFTHMSV